jgi:putative membrane protein
MLATLPLYLSFLGTAVGLLAVAMAAYVMVTPFKEITLIRDGNTAAAYSLGGTSIGMAVVLFSTASGTFNVAELATWGAVGLAGQIFMYVVVMGLLPGLRQGIEDNKESYGITLGMLSIAMGILNAGALST